MTRATAHGGPEARRAPGAGACRAPALLRVARFGRPAARRLALALAAGVGASAAAVGLSATSAWLIARAAQQPPVLSLMVAVAAVQAFGLGRAVLRYGERLASHDAAFRVLAELRGRAYARLERLAPAGLAAFRSGDLLTRLVTDVDGLADVWLRVLLPYGAAAVVGAGAVAVVGALAPAAGVALAVTLVVASVGVPLVAGRLTRAAEAHAAPARGRLAAAALELLDGAPELLAVGATPAYLARIAALDGDLAAAEASAAAGDGLGTLLTTLAAGAATWCALFAGVAAVHGGRLDGVWLAVVVLTTIAAHEVVAELAPAAQHLPGLAASAARVLDVLAQPDPVAEPATPAALPAGPHGLRIRGLRARYADGASDVLRGLDLDVAPGDRVLVTGPSGSGKSTLAAVLLRFLDAAGGSVELVGADGAVPLAALASDDVRRVIGLCEQDPHLFDSTLLENVRLARPDASDDDVRAALGRAQLLEWVESLPDGLDTPVGEHGARLSGGQRQRIAVARALLADVPVLVVDEPTEHVDERMAEDLVRDLLAATAGRTLIVMTHRPELMGATGWAARVDLGDALPRGATAAA